jgi:structure-specific recognition protein 1
VSILEKFNIFNTSSLNIHLCNREELKEKFEGRLSRDCNGPTYEVMSTVMKAMVNRKVTIPGNFTGYIICKFIKIIATDFRISLL